MGAVFALFTSFLLHSAQPSFFFEAPLHLVDFALQFIFLSFSLHSLKLLVCAVQLGFEGSHSFIVLVSVDGCIWVSAESGGAQGRLGRLLACKGNSSKGVVGHRRLALAVSSVENSQGVLEVHGLCV